MGRDDDMRTRDGDAVGRTGGRVWLARAFALLMGTVVALVVLELALRAGAGIFLHAQHQQNHPDPKFASSFRVVCIGESTTALGERPYPGQLQTILAAGMPGRDVRVFNAGIPGADTSIIVNQLEGILDKFGPHVVVAMMGANDHGGAIPQSDVPLAERRLFPDRLRIYRLVRQLRLTTEQQQTSTWRLGQRDGVATQEEGPVCRAVRRAWAAEARGELGRAEVILWRAGGADDVEIRTLLELARFLSRQARYTDAEPVYLEALERDPSCVAAYLELSHLYKHLREHGRSKQMIRNVLDLEPDNPVAHLWMAHTYDRDNMCEHRREVSLLRAIELDRTCTRAYIALADQLVQCSDRQRVPPLLEHGLSANPDDDALMAVYANYWLDQGDTELADEFFARANGVRVRRQCGMTRDNYARTLEILGRRGIPLVVVPYPMRAVEPLQALVGDADGVTFVDHQQAFRDALAKHGYRGLFIDYCNGDSGHGTPTGNRVLAEAVAPVVLDSALTVE